VSVVPTDTRAGFLQRIGWFDAAWYLQRNPAAAESSLEPLEHYLRHGAPAGIGPNACIDGLGWNCATAACCPVTPLATDLPESDETQLRMEMDFISASGLFDAAYYLDNNPDVAAAHVDPLWHFCKHGWRSLKKPNPDFDVWWYWVMYLDPAREAINPLVHYALVGRYAGLHGRPGSYSPGKGHSFSRGGQTRRICLFAGYDPDGIIDDYVVALARELSRYADVYYLADCFMPQDELDKLAGYTRGRWASRHGAYDFGSYSILARDYVGWDVIESYDELLLVNDSGYLLSGLDHVFARMDATACDWWGLQATKGLARTRHVQANQFSDPIPLSEVKSKLLERFEADYLYDFHVGSNFLAYRKPVIQDRRFRRLFNAVTVQSSKLRIIQKYEIGFTHYLVGNGFAFDTFIRNLYPFHPLYTRYHFDLIREGYPFLKRYFLSENHYDTPGLSNWKKTVLDLVPHAAVEVMERNLMRVSDYTKLYRSFRIVKDNDGQIIAPKLLNAGEFAKADLISPKFDHWWAFPACAFNNTFSGNERAVFEEVRGDPSIKKIVLARGKNIDVDGENVVVVPLLSPEGQHYLMRARQIFLKHSPTRNLVFPVSSKLHNLINLWHGIPVKRIGYASLDMQEKLGPLGAEHAKCRAVISSSHVDTLAMAAAFYPLSYNDVWCTGLPRNDFILCPPSRLPDDMREDGDRLQRMCGGRRLLLFMPTFKAGQSSAYYRFAPDEVSALHQWLRANEVVLGVREHMADSARVYYSQLSGPDVVDVGDRRFPHVEVLYRQAAALVTDYSSCFVDFMLTGRPMISFAYDHDAYAGAERGLFYDIHQVFPGDVCGDFPQLLASLARLFDRPDEIAASNYAWKRRLFFDYFDDANAWRLVRRVKELYVRDDGINQGESNADGNHLRNF
jgi:CDP-glycerol glycerophosphotransferase (TagB/SpsB family)